MGSSDRGRELVTFAYVVVRSDKPRARVRPPRGGSGPGEERDTNCLSRRVP